MLNFDYDSSQPTPRTRFTLTEGKLVDIDLFLACSRGQKLGITQEELKAYFGPPPGPNVEEIEQVLYSVAVLAKDVKGSAGTASVVRYEVLHAERPKGSFSNSVVHKDWFDTIQRSPKGPAPKCYGEIFDRTLRERVAPAPFSFLQPGMTPEEEKIASQQNEWYSKMDIQAIMKAGRSLGEGGGVVTSFKETGELKTIGMNHRLGRFTDLTEIAKLKEERKAAKKSKEGAGSS